MTTTRASLVPRHFGRRVFYIDRPCFDAIGYRRNGGTLTINVRLKNHKRLRSLLFSRDELFDLYRAHCEVECLLSRNERPLARRLAATNNTQLDERESLDDALQRTVDNHQRFTRPQTLDGIQPDRVSLPNTRATKTKRKVQR